MLQLFRRLFSSKIGVGVTLAFLVIIAIAFASSDVMDKGGFSGVGAGDRVAVVGGDKITASDLSHAATNAVDQLRQSNPTISMAAFVGQGGLEDVLSQLLDRRAISEYGRKIGLRAGDNLVNSEIRMIQAFHGPDGKFSAELYRQAIARQGLSDAMVRQDLGDGLLAKQVLVPAAFGAHMPGKLALRYAALSKERRTGSIATIPSAAYAPTGDPTTQQLSAFYDKTKSNYIRPERRVLNYFVFGESAIGAEAAPTEAEIAADYKTNAALYAASEKRGLSQLIVPTRQAAEAIRSKVQAGGSLEQAAREAGLAVSKIAPIDRQALAAQASTEVANAAFAATRGAIAAPARGSLGWYLVRVDDIQTTPARTLAQAHDEIAAKLGVEKHRQALADLSAKIEDELEGGAALADLAKELNAPIQATKPLTAEGRVYGTTETADKILAPALQSAFEMDEGEPQIAEVVPGKTFLVYEAERITPSAPAPLAEIGDTVKADWRRAQGDAAARAAADRVLALVAKGTPLAQALASEKKALPAVKPVSMTREQLAQVGQRVPPPLALLFSMARGTTKKLEAPANAGWYVIQVQSIEPGKLAPNDPLVAQARQGLGQLAGREYGEELRTAIRDEVGVERNAKAIAAVRKQLTGEN
jgi:peptidyl-prolyl cis-trans isomerase D